MKADIKADRRAEIPSLMEPLVIQESSRRRVELTDLAFDLAQKSSGFCRSLPGSLLSSIANLVRAMNCYYSNLIEGHDTHPVDIERALKNDYSTDRVQRDLQKEACRTYRRAGMDRQRWSGRPACGNRRGDLRNPSPFLCAIARGPSPG